MVPPSKEVQSLCVQEKVSLAMEEPGPCTRDVSSLRVLRQLLKLHLLPGHVAAESDKVQVRVDDDASPFHQV